MTHITRVDTPATSHSLTSYTRPASPNASHPDAREPRGDTSDLVVKSLDHASIWSRYNSKAGAIQHVVPEKFEGDE